MKVAGIAEKNIINGYAWHIADSQTNFVDKSPVLTISNYLNTHGVDHIQEFKSL